MDFNDLKTPELQERLKNAQNPEDLLALAKEEGVELTDNQLEGISGGGIWGCGSDCSQDYPVEPYYIKNERPEGDGIDIG